MPDQIECEVDFSQANQIFMRDDQILKLNSDKNMKKNLKINFFCIKKLFSRLADLKFIWLRSVFKFLTTGRTRNALFLFPRFFFHYRIPSDSLWMKHFRMLGVVRSFVGKLLCNQKVCKVSGIRNSIKLHWSLNFKLERCLNALNVDLATSNYKSELHSSSTDPSNSEIIRMRCCSHSECALNSMCTCWRF